jgi:serine/threonine-protein kinase
MLADRYRLDEPIEAGATGEVWSARDTVLNRPVAVKLVNQQHAADEAFVSRFRAESRHAAALSHSGVAQVFDYGEQESTSPPCPYLVMEPVSGQQLSALIAQAGALPANIVLDITAQAARALQAAHDIGITHRAVKPAHLLITEDGWVKVTDFAIAGVMPGSQITTLADAHVAGAAAYMAPEQAGGSPATPASDIYSLGVVAYECAAGRLPFSGETPAALAAARTQGEPGPLPDHIPAPVRALIMWMIAKDPWLRPRSALAVAETASALRAEILSSAGPQPATSAGPAAVGPAWVPTVGPARVPTVGPAGVPAVSTALPAEPAGLESVGPAGSAAVDAGPDPAGITPAQPWAPVAQPATSRSRRGRGLAVAAVAAGMTALCAAVAAMMLGGNPAPPTRHAHGSGPGGVQAVVPALPPTAHPGAAHAKPRRRTAAGGSKTARPARPAAPAPPPHQPASHPPTGNSGPSPSPRPSTSPSPDPSPTASTTPSSGSSSQTGPGTPPAG